MKSPHRDQPTGAVFLESFQLLVENLNEVFWIRSPDLRELYYVSPAFERIWAAPCPPSMTSRRSGLIS